MDLSQLTPNQQLVINLNSGSHLVLAPPGSGKTEILALRLVNTLEGGMSPQDMLCLTYY